MSGFLGFQRCHRHYCAEDDVLQRGDQLIAPHRGASEPAVQELPGINFLTSNVFSLSLILTNGLSYLLASLVNVPNISSKFSTSFARSKSLMLPVNVAYAEFQSDVISVRISERSDASLRTLYVSALAAPLSTVRFLSSCGGFWYRAVATVTDQSADKLSLSILLTLSTGTGTCSPSSDHACIHRCKAAMQFLNSPFSIPPSQFVGVAAIGAHGLTPL